MKKILFVSTAMAVTVLFAQAIFADKVFTVRDVKGRYVFSFQGELVGVALVAATGVIKADGKGNVTDGVRMITVNGVPATETFTCSITVQPNGTGAAVCPADNPAPGFPEVETYNFVLQDRGKGFRFIGTTAGTVIFGSGERQ
jgi:hypothetical protein